MSHDTHASGVPRQPRDSYAITENDITRDPTLPYEVKAVYLCLAGYADPMRRCFPGQDRIAYESSLSLRTVGKAIREGVDCGLWSVVHTQTSNVYQLHDRGQDRYVPGRGPRTLPSLPVGMRRRLEKREALTGHARDADEHNQWAVPEIPTQTTSSDAACGPLAAGEARPSQAPNAIDTDPRAIRLDFPAEFDLLSDGKVVQRLMRSSFGALRRIGLDLDDYGRDKLKRSLVVTLDKTGDARETADMLRRTLELARDGHPDWASMVVPLQAKAS